MGKKQCDNLYNNDVESHMPYPHFSRIMLLPFDTYHSDFHHILLQYLFTVETTTVREDYYLFPEVPATNRAPSHFNLHSAAFQLAAQIVMKDFQLSLLDI